MQYSQHCQVNMTHKIQEGINLKEKKHTSIDNQLEKLKGRNITIDQHEEKEIKKILERNNYYNLNFRSRKS